MKPIKIKAVILDDEILAREVLTDYLGRLEHVVSIRQFSNPEDARLYLSANEADLLLLDIEMPGINGIDFLKSLENPPVTIFTTAYRNYAYEGFELGVIDFLLKPISFPRFEIAVQKACDFLVLKEQNSDLEKITDTTDLDQTVFIKSGVQRIKLNLNNVTYLQGLKDYTIVFTSTGKIVVKGSVRSMHTIFPEQLFVRVHKSFIVSRSHVERIERNRLLLKDRQPIPIGRNYKEMVDQLFGGTTHIPGK